MNFRNLKITNFRNFKSFEIDFIPQVNIILGDNGQGKTNLVEALYVLTQGHSFRYTDNKVLIRQEEESRSAILRADIDVEPLRHQLALEILPNSKNLILNEKKISSLKLKRLFPIVLFSPESLAVIKESDEQRRQLIDDVLMSLGGAHSDSVQRFRKVLKMRNRILRDIRDQAANIKDLDALLQSLQPLYLQEALSLTQHRLQLLNEIREPLKNCTQRILLSKNKDSVDISVDYVISDQKVNDFSADFLMETLQKRADQLNTAERAAGTSLVGPHKHDIRFVYLQKDSRFFCSQGQQRALIIAFKMAQIVYHRKALKNDPILILDDVLSELDQDKRLALVDFLRDFSSQIFLTSTDVNLPDLGSDLKTSVRKIRQGALQTFE